MVREIALLSLLFPAFASAQDVGSFAIDARVGGAYQEVLGLDAQIADGEARVSFIAGHPDALVFAAADEIRVRLYDPQQAPLATLTLSGVSEATIAPSRTVDGTIPPFCPLCEFSVGMIEERVAVRVAFSSLLVVPGAAANASGSFPVSIGGLAAGSWTSVTGGAPIGKKGGVSDIVISGPLPSNGALLAWAANPVPEPVTIAGRSFATCRPVDVSVSPLSWARVPTPFEAEVVVRCGGDSGERSDPAIDGTFTVLAGAPLGACRVTITDLDVTRAKSGGSRAADVRLVCADTPANRLVLSGWKNEKRELVLHASAPCGAWRYRLARTKLDDWGAGFGGLEIRLDSGAFALEPAPQCATSSLRLQTSVDGLAVGRVSDFRIDGERAFLTFAPSAAPGIAAWLAAAEPSGAKKVDITIVDLKWGRTYRLFDTLPIAFSEADYTAGSDANVTELEVKPAHVEVAD